MQRAPRSPNPRSPQSQPRTAWIWAAGAIAWAANGLLSLRYPNKQHAQLAFLMAALFAVAWAFYRQPKK